MFRRLARTLLALALLLGALAATVPPRPAHPLAYPASGSPSPFIPAGDAERGTSPTDDSFQTAPGEGAPPSPGTVSSRPRRAGARPRSLHSDRWRTSYRRGFWYVAISFALVMAFGTAPTPLWPSYADQDGFGAITITEVFAVLVAGAAVGFLALGHLSDHYGRRRIVLPALTVAMVAAVVLSLWSSLPGLVVGRFLNGVAIGLMASTATAYLHDLYAREHPDRPTAARPAVVATAANLGGLALGPLVAGAVAQWLPHPLTLTQLGFAAALALSLLLTWTVPETVDLRSAAAQRPPRFALRDGAGREFASAAALGFFSFALFGLVTSLGAVMLRGTLGISSTFVAGLAPGVMFTAAAVGQLALARLPPARLLTVGALVFPVGLVLVALSLYHPSLGLYLAAVTVAGAGGGVLFKAGVARAGSAAAPASRAGVLAVYFTAAYAGLGLPSVLFSVAIRHWSTSVSMTGFAVVLCLGATLSAMAARRG
ncbi:MFS transporter [Streptomyces albipurpureus]|uniref:MFS transporter n=1 Tax=Streptomyces albipurpureus TaxID=2897419 RepID=A0ABT0UZ31_9ACTN|nr:MFS transporter [Streptomyces sp. CWNU-1]MCM2393813.1 MFS transporter [Streptomyces sp. CWNU-1]